VTNARRLLEDLVSQLTAQDEVVSEVPEPSPPGEHRRLCLGMSTFDDFDGVYFTVQAARLYHPEVLDQVSFLVLDNHPEGRAAADLRQFADTVPHMRYVPFRGYRSTAVRDLVFREADADVVMCVDSHVMLRPGAIRAVLEYFDAHPDSKDLVQGPLLDDGLTTIVGTHFSPKWGAGMFGQWDTDERAHDPAGAAFEIEMQGLGVFACRREAWPGINPRFRGFGGEEGYLHEKVRRNGGRVLCLPALAWAHRFGRPSGAPYTPTWLDRVRNYCVGWNELGWDTSSMEEHFLDHLGTEAGELFLSQARIQLANPFSFFDAIFCLNLDDEQDRWSRMTERFALLDIAWRVERFPAIKAEHGCTHSFRAMVAEARHRGYRNFLVLEDDALFLDQTLPVLDRAVADLAGREWDVFYLGGCVWSQSFPYAEGSHVLQRPSGLTCTHAVAFHHTAYDQILAEIPEEQGPEFDAFIATHLAIDQYLPHRIADGAYRALLTSPRVATQPVLTQGADADLGLRHRYII